MIVNGDHRAKNREIYICSSSETRALLLDRFDIAFVQKSIDFDESSIETTNAIEFVYRASKGKMNSAIQLYGLDTPLLCADTVISASDGKILRKAKNTEEARATLEIQSNSTISIITSLHYQTKDRLFTNISATHYRFAKFEEDDLKHYLQSGLWQGKAGACMVEGFCKKYISEVAGLESTAMGLQVEVLLPWI